MSDKLKPCPFCGSDEKDLVIQRVDTPSPYWYVLCEVCDASGPTSGTTTREARRLWNMREEADSEHE